MAGDLTQLTPDTRAAVERLLLHAKARGLTVRVDSALRTCGEQAALYAQGRTTPGNVVTQVKGCGSYHVLGRAVDLFVGTFDCADYLELGEFWEAMGGTWGGRFSFKDCVHFEWPHPLLDLDMLCPAGKSCEDAVASQPPAPGQPMMALLGALVGTAVAVVVSARG